MLGWLAGIPGQMATLLGRLTATRAGNLDYLTAAPAPASTALSTATWDATKAAKLAGAAQETTPLLSAPKASGLSANVSIIFDLGSTTCTALDNVASTTSTSFVDVLNYTGSGVLEFCAFMAQAYGSADVVTMEILIDGVTAFSGTQVAAGSAVTTKIPVGAITGSVVTLSAVPFKTSLQIRHKTSNAPVYCKTAYKMRKTS